MQIKSECDFCGQPIPERDFQKGDAVVLLKKAYCRTCAKDTAHRNRSSAARKKAKALDLRAAGAGSASPRGDASYHLKPGDHACGFFNNPAEQGVQLVRFVRDGLKNREKVLYIADAPAVEPVVGMFEKGGLSIDPFLRSGQLEIHPASHVYAPEGVFEPAPMMARIQLLLEQCTKVGYVGLRGAGEMSWALRGWPGSERLPEYEASLTSALRKSRLIALCQYDVSRFPAPLLDMARRTHERVLSGTHH